MINTKIAPTKIVNKLEDIDYINLPFETRRRIRKNLKQYLSEFEMIDKYLLTKVKQTL